MNRARWFVLVATALLLAVNASGQNGLEVLQLRPNFYMIAGAGGNIGVQVGGPPCVTTFEGGTGEVPHYLPEKNPFVGEMTEKFGVPREAVLGFPETLYPEYRKKFVR